MLPAATVLSGMVVMQSEADEDLEDCQPSPGSRCINEYDDDNGAGNLICVPDFNCSASGQVLVEGFPCESTP